jgi:hypothetical protein
MLEVCSTRTAFTVGKIQRTNNKANLKNVKSKIEAESTYIHRLAEAAVHLRMDKVAARQWPIVKETENTT